MKRHVQWHCLVVWAWRFCPLFHVLAVPSPSEDGFGALAPIRRSRRGACPDSRARKPAFRNTGSARLIRGSHRSGVPVRASTACPAEARAWQMVSPFRRAAAFSRQILAQAHQSALGPSSWLASCQPAEATWRGDALSSTSHRSGLYLQLLSQPVRCTGWPPPPALRRTVELGEGAEDWTVRLPIADCCPTRALLERWSQVPS